MVKHHHKSVSKVVTDASGMKKTLDDRDSPIIWSSPLIDPQQDLTEDEVIRLSTPTRIVVPSQEEDGTNLPPRHIYTYWLDFTTSHIRNNADMPEEPMDPSEARFLEQRVQVLMEQFKSNPPTNATVKIDEKSKDFMEQIWPVLSQSEFKNEILDFVIKKSEQENKLTRAARIENEKEFILSLDPRLVHRVLYLNYLRYNVYAIYRKLRSSAPKSVLWRIVNIFSRKGPGFFEDLFPLKPKLAIPTQLERLVIEQAEDPRFRTCSLHDRAILIKQQTKQEVTAETIKKIFIKNGYTRKLTKPLVPEANNIPHKNARVKVVKALIELHWQHKEIVSVDETQCNRSLLKAYGWAKEGETAIVQSGRIGKPIHIICAITQDRLLGYMLRNERIKGYPYKYFLMQVVDKLKEIDPVNYKERFFIFMDNAGAHKRKMVKDWIELEGITVLCNAPMTPQIQPIEYIFSMFKRALRDKLHFDREKLMVHIYHSFRSVAQQQIKIYNTFIHTFKFYKPLLEYQDLHTQKQFAPLFDHYGNNPISYSAITKIKKSFENEKKEEAPKVEDINVT